MKEHVIVHFIFCKIEINFSFSGCSLVNSSLTRKLTSVFWLYGSFASKIHFVTLLLSLSFKK